MGAGHSNPIPEHQAKIIPTGRPGETGLYRSIYAKDPAATFDNGLVHTLQGGKVTTAYENFQYGVSRAGDHPCLGERRFQDGVYHEYVFQTYNQVQTRVTNFGSGLVNLGIKKGDCIGLFSQNNSCWTIGDLACASYSYVSVPLYDTLGTSAVVFIAQQAEIKVVVCAKDKLKIIKEAVPSCPTLKYVVLMEAIDEADKSYFLSHNVQFVSFADVEAQGAAAPREAIPPKADDLFTICYTSGTTGNPKGAMLTHRNVVSNIAGVLTHFNSGRDYVSGLTFDIGDVHISYLPASHMFERLMQATLLGHGCAIGFYQGDVLKLMDDIGALRPTIFPSVPRLLNRLYDKITGTIREAGGAKEKLFKKAFKAKKANLRRGVVTHSTWDSIIFNKMKQRLGGRVRLIITGSAPIGADVMEFLRICFCCHVFEGYGQTEASAATNITTTNDCSVGHVGPPLPCLDIKLVDVPEMNYLSSDQPNPRGEVCFKGHNVFLGYYKDAQQTAEAIDADGWLHSGDIGAFLPNGTLKIIDRKKNIFKLAQGEYIAPEKIENIMVKVPLVAQLFVHGDSLQAYLVGVVVPDPEAVKSWGAANGVSGSIEEICKSEAIQKTILKEVNELGKKNGLKGFELLKDLVIDPVPFSVENDLLTPTFKLKRPQARKHYAKQIEDMYARIASGSS
eukprot:TRINITY_DN362_c0_g3_i1.p1 TRINITY_DN362_c0_g3~~TRINITY_DN362_c0_g3_i1.p1  ORF type:complete len:675 (-),score=149.65 TRINITY_DN362_c0_g3_i1:332-2356(-)